MEELLYRPLLLGRDPPRDGCRPEDEKVDCFSRWGGRVGVAPALLVIAVFAFVDDTGAFVADDTFVDGTEVVA